MYRYKIIGKLYRENEKLKQEIILLQASLNFYRLPSVGWKTGKTLEELEEEVLSFRKENNNVV